MIINSAATAISAVTSSRVPASFRGELVAGRRKAVGAAMSITAQYIHTPAFLKDVVSGVRAWSPPV